MPENDGKFECAGCNRRYTWKPELAGKRMRCKCGEPVTVPAALSQSIEPIEDGPPDFDSPEFMQAAALTATMPVKPPAPVTVSPVVAPRRQGKLTATAPARSAGSAPAKQKLSDQWWFTIGIGILLVVMGFYEFSRLSDMEHHGGSVYLTRYEYLMYMIGGKWGVLIFLLLFGALSVTLGIRAFLKLQREKA